jgi:nucleoside-diphosphate-sugar epimerase
MQTILGAGGAIGKELAMVLPKYTKDIRLVGRNPQKVNESDHIFRADLTQPDQVMKAVQGSEIVYLTAGFKYDIKVWQTTWPVVMQNVLDACKAYKTRLVFFDNIYMYDPKYMNHLTEDTPINPSSKKGKVRAELVYMIENAVEKGDLEALISRSADFYGPSIENVSVLIETVFKPLSKSKKANWLGPLNKVHSYTYTPDAGNATAVLGNTADAFNQTWHIPTDNQYMNGREWINAIADELGVKAKVQVVPKFMVSIMGLFNPIMREFIEMMYQYENDYIFESNKFESKFKIKPTPYIEGIRNIVQQDFK